MKITFEARGMNHYGEALKVSDVGNFRIDTLTHEVPGKNGRTYFVEFTGGARPRYRYRRTHKYTGAPLKKVVKEVALENALFVRLSFKDADGNCYGDTAAEMDIYALNLQYTKQGILDALNAISTNHYDSLEII